MTAIAKWQLTLGLAIAAGFASPAHPAAAASLTENPSVTIYVRNFAGVDAQTLARAKNVASRIFQIAGVVSQWVDWPISSANQQTVGPSHLWVSILPAAMADRFSIAEDVTGVAPGTGPNRTLVYVFYDRVLEMQAIVGEDAGLRARAGDFLGSVMAHEVGHILLNLEVHSKAGIMRGNWNMAVLYDILRSRLYFTKEQGEAMRAEIAKRTR